MPRDDGFQVGQIVLWSDPDRHNVTANRPLIQDQTRLRVVHITGTTIEVEFLDGAFAGAYYPTRFSPAAPARNLPSWF